MTLNGVFGKDEQSYNSCQSGSHSQATIRSLYGLYVNYDIPWSPRLACSAPPEPRVAPPRCGYLYHFGSVFQSPDRGEESGGLSARGEGRGGDGQVRKQVDVYVRNHL